jgi:hypothetical protein
MTSRSRAREALQIKHHLGGSRSLTDAGLDLWRTLAVWLEIAAGGAKPGNSASGLP